MSSDFLEALDVIRKGASQLKVGEMVSTKHFQLAQAISAVEIGDPRMDFPMNEKDGYEALIADGKLALGEPLATQLSIVNGLITRLAQWWTGVTLLQTVYTSLHMLALNKLQDEPFLGPVCAAMRAITGVCKSLILGGLVAEEEDCPIFSPGIPEEPAPSSELTEQTVAGLDDALKLCSANGAADDPAQLAAMSARLTFLKHVFQGLDCMHTREGVGVSPAMCRRGRAHFTQARDSLTAVRGTPDGAPGVHPSFIGALHMSAWALPPPPLLPMALPDALAVLERALQGLAAACDVTEVSSYAGLKAFLARFLDGDVLPIARTVLHSQLLTRETHDEDEVPRWAPSTAMLMQDMCLAPALVNQAPDVKMFVEQAQLATGNHIQALCMNKSRMRRRLRTRLEDYANLATHANNADVCIAPLLAEAGWFWPADDLLPFGPCSLWVEHEVCNCMLKHLYAGFELSLYSEAEYLMVYWYCDVLQAHLSGAKQTFLKVRPKATKAAPKKKGRQPSTALPTLTPDEMQRVSREHVAILIVELHRALCQGMLRLAVALDLTGLKSHSKSTFGSPQNLFDQRFESFQCVLAPMPLTYDAFVKSTDASELTHLQLLRLPLESFKQATDVSTDVLGAVSKAKDSLTEWESREVEAMLTVAKRNWFACSILAKTFDSSKDRKPVVQWDFSFHKHFPALTVKTK